MTKAAISVTLDEANLTWLKGRARAAGLRSVSELLDRLVSEARGTHDVGARSVVGTIDVDPADPLLETADDAIRDLYERSLGRPMLVRESPPQAPSRRRPAKRR